MIDLDFKKVREFRNAEFKRLIQLKAHGDSNGNFIVNGRRLILLGADYFMAEILNLLKKYVGVSGGAVLYNIGIDAGKDYFKGHYNADSSKEEALGKFFGFLMFSGYSKIWVDADKIVVSSAPTADMSIKLGYDGHKTCYYLAGMFAGFLSSLFGKQIDVRETKCMAEGNKHCEFEIMGV